MLIGYHASHEQHAPGELLDHVRAAESAGFEAVLSSDHFHPWLEENGHSGHAWSWLGAALQATRCPFGVVCAPGDRYHPTIVAQAAATLANIFPARFWLGIGTGEALNEHVTGNPWPPKELRQERLLECVSVMRALWRGETVTHRGHVTVSEARLYSQPESPPALFAAAVSEETAAWAAGWADGLITTGRPADGMRKIIAAFRSGGGAGKPIFVQHTLSWAPTEEDALRAAHEQWRFATLDSTQLWDLRTPGDFAAATRGVTPAQVAQKIRVSSDPQRHLAWIEEYVEAGVDRVFCFQVGKDQRGFIQVFAERVLPGLKS